MWDQIAIISVVGCLAVAFAIGSLVLGSWAIADKLSFAGLGFVVGLLTGLSESPVLAALVAGGFAIAGQVAAAYFSAQGTFAGIFLAPAKVWLFPMAAFASVGVLCGITLRANDSLQFRKDGIASKLRSAGFDEAQVKKIMARLANEVELSDISKSDQLLSKSRTYVLTNESGSVRSRSESTAQNAMIRQIAALRRNSDEDIVAQLRQSNPDDVAAHEASLKLSGTAIPSAAEIIKSILESIQ